MSPPLFPMTSHAMSASPPTIPTRIVLINVLLVLLWLPLIFGARLMIERVIAADPSEDLLQATYLSIIGTLLIVTCAYVFGLVLLNKYLTQNLEPGAQRRVVRPLVVGATVLYVAVAAAVFASI